MTPRWTAGIRYALTSTDTTTTTGIKDHTLDLRAAHEMAPRIWLRGGYVHGIENFDLFSNPVNQLDEFRANTVNVGVQVLLPSLTSIVGGYDYQWRDAGVRMGRINIGLVQAF